MLIGATTENPYFEVNSALLSRTHVYELHPLSTGGSWLCDARWATPSVGSGTRPRSRRRDRVPGRASAATPAPPKRARAGRRHGQRLGEPVTVELAEDAMQKKAVLYDKGGDKHYDYISAWIKSTRGSDVDASLYYLAVMLEGGEDPRFIARRMIVLASEDIGNADPQAL